MDCDGYPRIPMPLMCTAFVPGQIDAAVAGISDPIHAQSPRQKRCTFADRPRSLPRRRAPILTPPIPHCAIPACLICGYASLSLNRIADARRCLAGILDTPTDEESPAVHATHILFASAASVLLHLPSPHSAEEFYPLAAHLPEGLRLFASYVMAHALYLRGEYGRSSGHGGKRPDHETGKLSHLGLFLHLSLRMACMSLKDIDAAKAHFGPLGTLRVPTALSNSSASTTAFAGAYRGVLKIAIPPTISLASSRSRTASATAGGASTIPDSGEDVADDLTTTEFTMAMLACRGWTNAEIARHMGSIAGHR